MIDILWQLKLMHEKYPRFLHWQDGCQQRGRLLAQRLQAQTGG